MIDRSWHPGSAISSPSAHTLNGWPRGCRRSKMIRRSPVVARPSRSGRQQAKQARSSPAIQPPHYQRTFGLLMGGKGIRTMIDQSRRPGSADVPSAHTLNGWPTGTSAAPRVTDLLPPALPVSATTRCANYDSNTSRSPQPTTIASPASAGQSSSSTRPSLHPQRTSDLARGRRTPCSSRTQACCEPPTLARARRARAPVPASRAAVSRRGRRRSPPDLLPPALPSIPQQRGAAITILIPRTLHSPQPSTSPHLQANRPPAAPAPPTADLRPRTGAQTPCSSTPGRAADL